MRIERRAAPFLEPLSGYGGGGFFTYAPLPYRKSLKVLVKADAFPNKPLALIGNVPMICWTLRSAAQAKGVR